MPVNPVEVGDAVPHAIFDQEDDRRLGDDVIEVPHEQPGEEALPFSGSANDGLGEGKGSVTEAVVVGACEVNGRWVETASSVVLDRIARKTRLGLSRWR